jgi:4-amino-4-deoxy-L-arabinose transferase-like glycosyltransferase
VVGNHILYDDGHYLRNLVLARCGMLPILVAISALVFRWTQREFGGLAAFLSVFFLTTTPIVLALSSIAYTDLVAATTQFAALFAFTIWLREPNKRSTLLLGLALGLAVASKLTSFIFFLPAAAAAVAGTKLLLNVSPDPNANKFQWRKLTLAMVMALLVLWAGYGFSVGHVQAGMGLSPGSMPSFQHFPKPIGRLATAMVVKDALIPAPSFLRGVATAWVLNKTSPPAYLLGHVKPGGWWYFFLIGIAFKSPLPFLILCGIGLLSLAASAREKKWSGFAPAASVLAIRVITLPVKYNAGTRHVLVVFPLLAMIAGQGGAYLWRSAINAWDWKRLALVVLLLWQGIESARARNDFISYFNELAGRDPSRVMVAGCDLDCGQDIFGLARELQARNISHVSLAVWSSADMQRMGLPEFEVLHPYQPATGWLAISARLFVLAMCCMNLIHLMRSHGLRNSSPSHMSDAQFACITYRSNRVYSREVEANTPERAKDLAVSAFPLRLSPLRPAP